MSKVFVNIGLTLDGYMAPEGMSLEHWKTPGYKDWGAKWGALMAWILRTQYFRETLKFGPGGDTGPVNDMARHTMERTGANIMGRRMFEQGEVSWPEEAPFHTPVYVLTHEKREPWARPGGTTFHFVNDGPERAGLMHLNLTPGRYLAACGTPEQGPAGTKIHAQMGMVEVFEIR